MSALILDYLPASLLCVAMLYSMSQALHFFKIGKYRWVVYGTISLLCLLACDVSVIQVDALRLYEQAVALPADCADYIETESLAEPVEQ